MIRANNLLQFIHQVTNRYLSPTLNLDIKSWYRR